jgi:hypothetical protein
MRQHGSRTARGRMFNTTYHFSTIDIEGGNIVESGVRPLCSHYGHSLDNILKIIK